MVGVLFNSSTVRELSTLKEHILLLDKLAPWLRSTDIPFPEVYEHFMCENRPRLCYNSHDFRTSVIDLLDF